MKKPILLFKSKAGIEEEQAVLEVLRRGTYWANGPEIKEFEDLVSNYHGRDYAVAFNSGTSGLYANLLAQGIDSGEVIVPSFTFPATANSVVLAGAKPVFADIEIDTLGLDYNSVESKITSETKAIMPIHFAGAVSRDIKKLKNLSDKYDIPLIEDNAQSIGATLEGKLTGTFGNSAALSFCFNKVITTGEGGMVLTDDSDVQEKLKLIRSHGRDSNKDYVLAGHNMRMPTINAAIGLAQFSRIEEIISMRRHLANYYDKLFSNVQGVEPLEYPKENKSVYCSYNVLFDSKSFRDKAKDSLGKDDIGTRISYPPVHLEPFYQKNYGTKKGDLPVTEEIFERTLTLPFHLNLTNEEQERVVDSIK